MRAKLPRPFFKWGTYDRHTGIDFPYAIGTLVKASGDGVVTRRGWLNSKCGWGINVSYDIGVGVAYCHYVNLNQAPEVGTGVEYGDILGLIGESGSAKGPHLHAEIITGKGAGTQAAFWEWFSDTDWVGNPNSTHTEEDDMYTDKDRERDALISQALWNRTSNGGEWPGVLERLERLEADNLALAYTLDGREVPAAVNNAQGGPKLSYWRKLGRFLAEWTPKK